MFIEPTLAEQADFKPDFTILNACQATCDDFEVHGLRSDVFIAFNLWKSTSKIMMILPHIQELQLVYLVELLW